MNSSTQKGKAELLRQCHTSADIFLLPCAWDVASAKLFEIEGFKAVGTTSAGVSAALGCRDGQHVDFEDYLVVIRRIVRRVQTPVTVDIEAGYATAVDDIVANVRRVLEAGGVGINIEDEDHLRRGGQLMEPVATMVERIRAIRAMSDEYGVPILINAKTDAFLLSVGISPEAIFEEAVSRGNAYAKAGADCVFVPGNLDLEIMSRLVSAISCPLNIVVKKNTPCVADLQSIGVKRLSLGSGPMRGTMGLTRKIAKELLSSGTYESFLNLEIPYDEVNELFDA